MSKRNPHLDILRALAVVMVILSHEPVAPAGTMSVIAAPLAVFHQYGGLGVDLFFVLSGFLVSGLLFREHYATGSTRIGRFLIRRGFKIYPAFYVFIFTTALIRFQRGDTTFTRFDVLGEALFVQNYGPHLWSHTWSLAVEEHFYLLLAGLVLLLQRRSGGDPFRRIPLIFAITTTCVLVARAITFRLVPYSGYTHHFPTHLQLDALFFGVVLSYFYHSTPRFVKAVQEHTGALYFVSAICLVAAQALPGALGYVVGHALTYVGFGALVIAAVATPTSTVFARWIRPVAAVGEQSYSIYLWHTAVYVFGLILVTKLLGREPTYYQTVLGYLPLALIFGIVMARVVELPTLRLRDWLFPDRRSGSPQLREHPAGFQKVAAAGVDGGTATAPTA
jgi:peptidoglycan/LPS O-acetylase OafA/YrhL